MPTIISHAVVPLAVGLGLGREIIPRRLLIAGMVAAMAPDLDVLAFRFGIPYASTLGHRGFSHSLLFAALLGLIAGIFARAYPTSLLRACLFAGLAAASHGLLDAVTNGGEGVAFFWPWSPRRYFFAQRFIEVSPIGLTRIFSSRGLAVLRSEAIWIWTPCLLLCLGLSIVRDWIFGMRRKR